MKTKEERSKYRHDYYIANKEKHQEQARVWRAANKEHIKEQGRAYRDAHKEEVSARAKAWAESHRGRVRQIETASRFRRRYGIEVQDYEELFAKQKGRCAICGSLYPLLSVDHAHDTGKVRGLLCTACNTGLGLFGDSSSILRSAAIYLEASN